MRCLECLGIENKGQLSVHSKLTSRLRERRRILGFQREKDSSSDLDAH